VFIKTSVKLSKYLHYHLLIEIWLSQQPTTGHLLVHFGASGQQERKRGWELGLPRNWKGSL